jgi:hypothetical protein
LPAIQAYENGGGKVDHARAVDIDFANGVLAPGEGIERAEIHSGAAAIQLDSRARVEAIDDVFCAWSGFSGSDIVGHRFVDLISQPLRREAGELLERVLREAVTAEISLILLGKRGDEMPGVLALALIMIDCVAHGAQALWAPGFKKQAERAA